MLKGKRFQFAKQNLTHPNHDKQSNQLLLNLDDMEKLTKKDIQEITEIFTNMLAGILIWEILKFLFYLLLLP